MWGSRTDRKREGPHGQTCVKAPETQQPSVLGLCMSGKALPVLDRRQTGLCAPPSQETSSPIEMKGHSLAGPSTDNTTSLQGACCAHRSPGCCSLRRKGSHSSHVLQPSYPAQPCSFGWGLHMGDGSFWHLYQLGTVLGAGKTHCNRTEIWSNGVPEHAGRRAFFIPRVLTLGLWFGARVFAWCVQSPGH